MDFVSLIVWLVAAAVVLLIVDRLNVGLKVGGFVNAIVAAAVIAIIAWVALALLGALGITLGGDFLGLILLLIVAALVLMFAGRILKGLSVSGFGGAIISAIAIAVVAWLLGWLLGLLGITF